MLSRSLLLLLFPAVATCKAVSAKRRACSSKRAALSSKFCSRFGVPEKNQKILYCEQFSLKLVLTLLGYKQTSNLTSIA